MRKVHVVEDGKIVEIDYHGLFRDERSNKLVVFSDTVLPDFYTVGQLESNMDFDVVAPNPNVVWVE